MPGPATTLDDIGLRSYQALCGEAAIAVSDRFYEEYAADYADFGEKGRVACREDLGYHLEFLRPVLEFGLAQPLVDYLNWLEEVLVARGVPAAHLPQSLDWLGEFFVARMPGPGGQLVAAALADARDKFLARTPYASLIDRMMPSAWPQSEAFQRALLEGNRREVQQQLESCLAEGVGLVDFELHVVQPALYAIGRGWQANEVTVAQEHMATALSQSMMNQGLARSAPAEPNGKKVVLACVEGNHHCVGLQMVADAFQLDGWEVNYLGANVPIDDLVIHVAASRPNLVGLSLSFAQQFRAVREIMRRLDDVMGAGRPAVILGGLAINQFDSLAGVLGADAWSTNARLAVTYAATLAPRAAGA